jgi:hypothetical protein
MFIGICAAGTTAHHVQRLERPQTHLLLFTISPANTMQFLPQNVLVRVLQHVKQSQRLTSCALVSTAWAEAAAMATSDIYSRTRDSERFMPWLQHHGSHVTSFQCDMSRHPTTRIDWDDSDDSDDDIPLCNRRFPVPLVGKTVWATLPCSNLMKLTLSGCAIQLSTLMQVATGLTSLTLNMDKHQDFSGGLQSLTALHALPALQYFNLTVRPHQSSGLPYNYQPSDNDVLHSCVISGLTNLTSLQLTGVLALESLQPFNLLTNLHHLEMKLDLEVEDPADAGQQSFRQLQALTHLSMRLRGGKLVSTSSSPAFAGCSGLQELRLHSTRVDASAFYGLTGLTKLHLWVADVVEDGAVGVVALLGHISSMQQLQDLALDKRFLAAAVAVRDSDAAACGGITASAKLKCLRVCGLSLPRASWVHLFPPGRRLLQLHQFELCFGGTCAFDCSALEQLVHCCPAIEYLSSVVMKLFAQDVSLAPLLRLQQLARLECPRVVDDAGSVGVLARLSSLTSLCLSACPGLSDVGLLQLTALTGLQVLAVRLQDGSNHRLSVVEVIQPGNHHASFMVSTWYGLHGCRAIVVISGKCIVAVCVCLQQQTLRFVSCSRCSHCLQMR